MEPEFPTPFIGLTSQAIGPGDMEIPFFPLVPKTQEEAAMIFPAFLSLMTVPIKIVHYMPASRWFQLVASMELYMSRLCDQSKDLNDGNYPSGNDAAPTGMNKEFYDHFKTVRDVTLLKADQTIARQLTYIHCWFASPEEDRRMWTDFADGGEGLMLCSTSNALFAALQPFSSSYRLTFDQVRYIEEQGQLLEFVSSLPSVRKDPSFAHENEVRLMAELILPKEGVILESLPRGIKAPIKLSECLDAVIAGPTMTKARFERIQRWMRCSLPNVKLIRSHFETVWKSQPHLQKIRLR